MADHVKIAVYIMHEQKKLIKEKNKNINQNQYVPERIEDYTPPTLEIPKSRSVKCTKEKLSKVLAFIDYIKYLRCSDCCTGNMPIPTTNKKLISICGSHREVSRLIQFMKQLNLIKDYDNKYKFNTINNKSKTYYYYIEIEKQIQEYCKNNNINIYVVKNERDNNNSYNPLVDNLKIDNFDDSQVRFSSKLHLLKPDNYTTIQFEDYLTSVLHKNYPDLLKYQKLADEINQKYYKNYPEMSLRFIPTFTWNQGNKSIKKIGIRCTNALSNAKKEKNKNENFFGIYKEDILKKYKLFLEKDVKSSIPRITLSINKGKWISEDVDIYEMIFNEFKQDDIPFLQEYREAIKSLHMRCYFDTDTTICRNVIRSMYSCKNKEDVSNVIKILKAVVQEVEGGKLYDNEIFYHESCIYIDVLNELLKNKYMTWLCYDCFYSNKKNINQNDYNRYVKQLVEDKANNYINKLNNNNNNK